MGSSTNQKAVKPTKKLILKNSKNTSAVNRLARTMRTKIYKISNAKTQLLLLLVSVYYMANHMKWFAHPEDSLVSDIRMGIFGTFLFLTYLGTLLLPEPNISRPHPLFWRLVQGAVLAYVTVLCFLLFLSKDNMQFVLQRVFDDKLGKPLPEKDYASDCRVYTPEHPESNFFNVKDAIWDMFMLAHFFGWVFKSWIFRNTALAWILSGGFELMEYTMEVWLENFKECWWDHYVLDMFGCNLLGMLFGAWTISYFGMRQYNWFMEPNEKMEKMTKWEKFKYYFTSRDEYVKKGKWHWLADYWTLHAVVWYVTITFLLDLSYFYNKTNLEIPPPHWLFAIRIYIIGFFSILATADYYDYITKRKANAMGVNAFMIHVILILEFVLWLKHLDYDKIFKQQTHFYIKIIWAGIFAFIALLHIYISTEKYCKQLRKSHKTQKENPELVAKEKSE